MDRAEQDLAEYPVSWSVCVDCGKRIYTRPKFRGHWLHVGMYPIDRHVPRPKEEVDVTD